MSNLPTAQTLSLVAALDAVLPDSKIRDDVNRVLTSRAEGNRVTLQFEDEVVFVPVDAPVHVVTKGLYRYYPPPSMGIIYRVVVAIGEMRTDESGEPEAAYCFATLRYNETPQLSSITFEHEW